MAEFIEYPCGLRVVVQNIPYVRSVSAGVWVGTGSALESKGDNGISHYIEHVLFKGTDKLSALDIANSFEQRGAVVNAFTSKETTCFYFKSIDSDAQDCFSTLTELFFHSIFDSKELDSERKVVLEEINMDDDSPEDLCYDRLATALYGDRSFGMPVLGTRENVSRFNKDDILRYIKNQYCAEAIVIAFVGNITLAAADEMVKKTFLPLVNKDKQLVKAEKIDIKPSVEVFIKDFKQANLMLGYPSICYSDKKTSVQAALNVILGGCMGSRLFQHIREKKGLAYSVYSSPSRHSACGSLNIALNINEKNTLNALNGVMEEIELLKKDGVTQTELDMAKAQLKSNLIFGQENVQTIMLSLGKNLLLAGEVFEIDAKLGEIEAVTVDQVNSLIKETFSAKPALAYVGKDCGVDFKQILGKI